MNEHTEDSRSPEPARGESCSTTSGCPSCGGSKFLLLLAAGLVAVYFFSNRPNLGPAAPSAVKWAPNYEAGLAAAKENNQPVLLAFKASWCGPCRAMDNEVFAKEAAAKALSGWVAVHVDIDEHGKLAGRYDISGVPTFVALSPSGVEIARTSGGMSLSQFGEFVASAEARLKSTAQAN